MYVCVSSFQHINKMFCVGVKIYAGFFFWKQQQIFESKHKEQIETAIITRFYLTLSLFSAYLFLSLSFRICMYFLFLVLVRMILPVYIRLSANDLLLYIFYCWLKPFFISSLFVFFYLKAVAFYVFLLCYFFLLENVLLFFHVNCSNFYQANYIKKELMLHIRFFFSRQ